MVSDDMVVVIGLKKMVVSVVFGYIQMVFINVIINFGVHRRFKTGDE
jgi:hypothetical protein